jgi:hypothetical protein
MDFGDMDGVLGKKNKKNFVFKYRNFRALKILFKKGLEKACEIKKECYFCTRI